MPVNLSPNPSSPTPSPSFTVDDIIEASRNRTGNFQSKLATEEYVPDDAIKSGMRSAIIELNDLFGQSGARRETIFQTVAPQPLATPAAPTLTALQGTGVLPAGSYQYRVSAVRGIGETVPGPEAASPAVLSGVGQVTVSWSAIPYADGYRIYGRTAGQEQLLKQVQGNVTSWTDTGVAMLGSSLPANNTTGSASGFLQDYDIAAYIGDDVEEIEEVLRSDAYRSDFIAPAVLVDPMTGIPSNRSAFIDQGFQQDVYEEMVGMNRWTKNHDYSWEVVNTNGSPALRLMPAPTRQMVVSVRYIASSEAVETLPEEARLALEYAACVAILDGVLNRVNSNPAGMSTESARGWRAWLDMIEKQRDRYESKYREQLSIHGKG